MNRCLFVLFISTAIAAAHSGNRVFPFYQLTDEMLEKIDIHDGSVEEWHEIGEPSMTLLDFQTVGNFIPPDPSNLDARIWLAWHDESNRIYAAFVIIDDTYHNTNDVTESMYWSDSVTLSIDADHSGGSGRSLGCPFLVALSRMEAFLAGGAALHPVGSSQPSEPSRVARRQIMLRFVKHLVAAVLLAGGVLLAGTSFVGAHIPGGDPNSCYIPSHHHSSSSAGVCAYSCILKGHNNPQYDPDLDECSCCDFGSYCG